MPQAIALDTIHQGDCIAGMGRMRPGSVDLAFADPPFNIGYEYDVYDDKQDAESYLDWSRRWIAGVHRVLKPAGTFWLAIGDEYAAELKIASRQIGFHCRSWIVWYYTFGVNCKYKFSRSHAHLFHFVKDPENFTFNHEAIRVPSARQLVYADGRANPVGRLPDDTWILRPQDCVDGFTPDEDTWYFPRVAGTFKERAGFHGCQMPEQLLGRIVRSCSNPGELVLDPFAGSATTLAVAKKLGRRWLGFELSADYVARGLARLGSVACGDRLDGAEEPRVSAPRTPGKNDKERSANAKALKGASARSAAPAPAEVSFETALIRAYAQAHDGFSVDRVVADPELNDAFLDTCRENGLLGDAFTLNRALFGLRKAGRLEGVPTTRRTQFGWADYDRYIFASEIALRMLIDRGSSGLDDVLCDPEQAREFDRIAASFAPGFSSLEYRWAALKLRKEAKIARTRRDRLAPAPLSRSIDLDDADRWGGTLAAVYLLYAGRRVLYAGETVDLAARIERQIADRGVRAAWNEIGEPSHIRLIRFLATDGRESRIARLAHQSRLVGKYEPALNFYALGAV